MSCAIDVNVLLYASDGESPFSQRAHDILSQLASRREPVCIARPTIMAYLRISTHGSIFAHPLSPAEAMNNIEALLSLPQVRLLAEEEGFWETYREVVEAVPARGNMVPVAHLAALLRQHGVNIPYTNDRDFRKYDFLKIRNPFADLGG